MNGPGSFFLILISILGFAWFASKDIPIGTGTSLGQGLKTPYSPPQKLPTDVSGIGIQLDLIAADLERVKNEFIKAQSDAERSKLSDYVSFDGSGNAGSEDAAREYFSFTVSSKAPQKVNITGWTLKSPITGISVTIPKGIYLPLAGQVVEKEYLFVSPGDKVTVVTGRSPTGTSFRLNKCTGYLEQFQDFNPSLPLECPRPEKENLPKPPNNLNDACLDFLQQIPRCTMPINNLPLSISPECNIYMRENINYGRCVQKHKNDKDFYNHEWRVYLERDQQLWKDRREVIKLLDTNGKTIDAISY